MTPRARIITALRRGQPDRVPVTIYEQSPLNDSWPNREPSYAPLLELEGTLGDSFVWPEFGVPSLLASATPARSSRKTEPDGTTVTTTELDTPRGPLRWVYSRAPGLMTAWQMEPAVKTDADIERVLSLPDPPLGDLPAQVRALQERVGERGFICFNPGDAIGHVVGLFRFEDFVLRCRRDDGPIMALLERSQHLVLRAIRALGGCIRETGFRLWGPEYCGKPLMNPHKYFRRYVVDFDRAATEAIHATGNFSIIHCHGMLRDLLDMVLEIGADGLEPLELMPMPTADVTMAEVKERIGGRMCLMGGVQAVTLENGTPEQMRDEVRACLAAAAPGGGYIVLPTSAPFMVPLTPQTLANAEAMYRAVHEFGVYA
jgi:hypothetical protein